jgi:hypothetical protein
VPPAHHRITVRRQPAPATTGDRTYLREEPLIESALAPDPPDRLELLDVHAVLGAVGGAIRLPAVAFTPDAVNTARGSSRLRIGSVACLAVPNGTSQRTCDGPVGGDRFSIAS